MIPYSRVSAINPVSARKVFTSFAFCGALEFFGVWLAVDTLPYTIFTVLCVLCAQKFGEFFLRYDANWKPIAVHQLMSSPPTKMMDRWNMTNLGAGNRLALAAGLRDWCKVLCCTLFSNIRKILRIFTNLRKILRMLLIGVNE